MSIKLVKQIKKFIKDQKDPNLVLKEGTYFVSVYYLNGETTIFGFPKYRWTVNRYPYFQDSVGQLKQWYFKLKRHDNETSVS